MEKKKQLGFGIVWLIISWFGREMLGNFLYDSFKRWLTQLGLHPTAAGFTANTVFWLSALVVTAVGLVYVYKSGASSKKKSDALIPQKDAANAPEENPFIPLQEASRTLYTEMRSPDNLETCFVEEIASSLANSHEEGVLLGMAFIILLEIPSFGRRPPSTRLEPIDNEICQNRSGLRYDENGVASLSYALADTSGMFTDIAVRKNDLAALIVTKKERAQHVHRQIHQS